MNNFIPVTIIICTLLIFDSVKKFVFLLKSVIINMKKYNSSINLREELINLSPREFKQWCGDFLKARGYANVVASDITLVGTVDIKCSLNEEKIYVECKRYSSNKDTPNKVNVDIVKKLVGAMEGDLVKHGMIITTGRVSSDAREFIKTLPEEYSIDIIDGNAFDIVYDVEDFDFCLIK